MSVHTNVKSNITQTAIHMVGPISKNSTLSPRNATGTYVGTSDPLTVGKVKSNIPSIARGRLAPPHFFRPPHTTIERKRQDRSARSDDSPQELSPRRSDAIRSLDPPSFQQLTRQNPRRFTKSNNSGVKHFELLRKSKSKSPIDDVKVEEEMLINELSRSRFVMLGIATCFDHLNVKSEDNVKTLLPKRRTRSSPIHRPTDGKTPQIGMATLMANLPHSPDLKNCPGLPARSPGPTFYRHFGMENRVESWHNSQIAKRIESNIGATSGNDQSASQLSSIELHRTGFLTRGESGSNQSPITDINVERIFSKSDSEQKKVLRENIEVPCPPANTRPTTRDEVDGRPPAPPSTSSALARGNSEVDGVEDEERDKVSEMSSPMPPRSKHAPPRRIQSMSQIDISVHNEEGEADTVEIDIADEEVKEETKCCDSYDSSGSVSDAHANTDTPYARRQSISDRISRRRHSELAAEIIRLSAENRRREFAELLNEHKQLVMEIESNRDMNSSDDELHGNGNIEENKENEQT